MSIRPADTKLAELVLFVSERSEGDPRFGAIKLNKILFLSDFSAYLATGNSITGQEYQKLKIGPAPRRLLPVRDALVADGSLAIRKAEHFNKYQDRTFALREPDLSAFTAGEIALVTQIIASNWERNGAEMSDPLHDLHGWSDVALGETIPYELTLVSNRPPTEGDLLKCEEAAAIAAQILSGKEHAAAIDA